MKMSNIVGQQCLVGFGQQCLVGFRRAVYGGIQT